MPLSALQFLRGLCVCHWLALSIALGHGTFGSILTPFCCAVLFLILWNFDFVSLRILIFGESSVCHYGSLRVFNAPLLRQSLQICSSYSFGCSIESMRTRRRFEFQVSSEIFFAAFWIILYKFQGLFEQIWCIGWSTLHPFLSHLDITQNRLYRSGDSLFGLSGNITFYQTYITVTLCC